MFQESPFSGVCATSTLEVLLMLVGTLLLGLLLGYLLWGWVKGKVAELELSVRELTRISNLKENQIADLNTRMLSLREDADTARTALRSKETQYASAIGKIKDLTDEVDTLKHDTRKKSSPPKAQAPSVVKAPAPKPKPAEKAPAQDKAKPTAEKKTKDTVKPASKPSTQPLRKGSTKASLAITSEIFGKKIEANDLKLIEGIGPKIADILAGKGLKTWAKLSQARLPELRKILEEAGPRYRLHEPKTWPRQARMAAKGEWKKLKAYQDTLKGGK